MHPKQWFFYAAVATELMGLAIAVCALSAPVAQWTMGLIFPGDVVGPVTAPGQLGMGLAGAVLAGWGTTMAGTARSWDRLSPKVVAGATAAGLLVWFLVDNAVSIALGAYGNVAGNTLFLALILPPVLKLRKA